MSNSMNTGSSSTISQEKTDDLIAQLLPDNKPTNGSPNSNSSSLAKTLAGAANLANLLPTGTLLLFQVLCPLLSNNGHCDYTRRYMTAILLVCCGLSGFLASFTDSFGVSGGKVHYGLATLKGLYLFENLNPDSEAPNLAKYKLRVMDFVHAFLSLLVFAAVALYDKNVVGCFYPTPKVETQEVLGVLPLAIGLVCTMLLAAFPTTRHGIGYPVSHPST